MHSSCKVPWWHQIHCLKSKTLTDIRIGETTILKPIRNVFWIILVNTYCYKILTLRSLWLGRKVILFPSTLMTLPCRFINSPSATSTTSPGARLWTISPLAFSGATDTSQGQIWHKDYKKGFISWCTVRKQLFSMKRVLNISIFKNITENKWYFKCIN